MSLATKYGISDKRYFNGKPYFLAGVYSSRRDANTVAEQYKKDSLVRLIWIGRHPIRTAVYTRPRK